MVCSIALNAMKRVGNARLFFVKNLARNICSDGEKQWLATVNGRTCVTAKVVKMQNA
jgi:hypothetical protein